MQESEIENLELVAVVASDQVQAVVDEFAVREEIAVETCPQGTDAVDFLTDQESVDCLVTDHDPPELDALAVLDTVTETTPQLPVVLLTTVPFEEFTDDPLAAGAADFRHVRPDTAIEPLLQTVRQAVTASRREAGLATAESKFEAVLQHPRTAIGVLDTDGYFLDINDWALRFADLEDERRIVGEPLWETPWAQRNSESIERYQQAIDRALDGELVEFETSTRDVYHNLIDVKVQFWSDDSEDSEFVVTKGKDVTPLKLAERRLAVIDRVLRHNLRNDLQKIKANAQHIAGLVDGESATYAAEIDTVVERLTEQSNLVRRMEGVLSIDREPVPTRDFVPPLQEAIDRVRDSYPDACIDATLPDEQHARMEAGIDIAFHQLLKNAVQHNDSENPHVSVSVSKRSAGPGTTEPGDPTSVVDVRIDDDGPGIPALEIEALESEVETKLEHGSGIGLWCTEWIIENSGGVLMFPSVDKTGTEVAVLLPAPDADVVGASSGR